MGICRCRHLIVVNLARTSRANAEMSVAIADNINEDALTQPGSAAWRKAMLGYIMR